VVCCRLSEYRWLPKRLKLNGAIRIEPLSSEEVRKYLAGGGSKLEALRGAIDVDPVLKDLAQTPLVLRIMSLAYQGVGGDKLVAPNRDSPEERRKQIFHLYVEQMFQRKGTAFLLFPKEKTIGGIFSGMFGGGMIGGMILGGMISESYYLETYYFGGDYNLELVRVLAENDRHADPSPDQNHARRPNLRTAPRVEHRPNLRADLLAKYRAERRVRSGADQRSAW
jgi:hypothetical protein